jgi:hypothetical protein
MKITVTKVSHVPNIQSCCHTSLQNTGLSGASVTASYFTNSCVGHVVIEVYWCNVQTQFRENQSVKRSKGIHRQHGDFINILLSPKEGILTKKELFNRAKHIILKSQDKTFIKSN